MKVPAPYKFLDNRSDNQYLVINEITNVVCIMKVLTVFDTTVFKFLKENKSKYIPEIFEFGLLDEKLYVFEEFIQGTTLQDYLLQSNVTDDEKIRILLEVCEALKFIHSAPTPIIHRDLKPTNIMLTSDRNVKVIDYDAARSFKVGKDEDTVFVGTQKYAAPEQYGFGQSDPRTDIFALGKLIQTIFSNNTKMQRVVDKACQIKPEDRFQTIDEMIYAIKHNGRSLNFFERLIRLPGFRTRKVGKMFIAIPCYLLVGYMIVFLTKGKHGWSLAGEIISRVFVGLMFFLVVDISFNWVGLVHDILPPLNSKYKGVRIATRIISILIILWVFWIGISVIARL